MFYYLYGAGVFIRRDRITIQEKEKEEAKKREMEIEAKKIAEERRSHTLKVPTLNNHKKYFLKTAVFILQILTTRQKSHFFYTWKTWIFYVHVPVFYTRTLVPCTFTIFAVCTLQTFFISISVCRLSKMMLARQLKRRKLWRMPVMLWTLVMKTTKKSTRLGKSESWGD